MIWMPCSAPRLNSKILNFSNNHFGHLTSFLNAKHDDQNQNTLQSTLDFRNLQIVKFLDLVKFLLLTKFLLNKTLEIVKFLFMFESPIF